MLDDEHFQDLFAEKYKIPTCKLLNKQVRLEEYCLCYVKESFLEDIEKEVEK